MKIRKKIILWLGGVLLLLAMIAGVAFWARPIGVFSEAMYLRECVSGIESRAVIVGGHRMHYLVEGPVNGPVIVLIHGLSGRAEDWRNLAPYLTKAGFRVYLPDLPGFGRSDQPADFSYSVPDQAAMVASFLDALGLKQVDLGGWSMGGWIVQRVALDHPDRIRRLILFDSAGIFEKPTWDTRLFTPTTSAELDQLDALLMPHPPRVPGYIARDILRISKKNAWIVHRALDNMLTAKETTDKLLPGLKLPVLIVWGSEDKITPLSQGETIHQLVPYSKLEVFFGCGHLAPLQCANDIGPKLAEFVTR